MCVVVACKLPVGPDGEMIFCITKNRDRNYVPTIHFKKKKKGSLEYRYIEDEDTTWTEGINSSGICMVNASLMVIDDEKEIDKKKKKKSQGKISHDAKVFKDALKMRDVRKVAKYIADNDVMGYTFVTDGRELFLIESVREWSKEPDPKTGKKYPVSVHKSMRQITDEKYVVRTNHGTYFSETGYPSGSPDGKSSRHRQQAVEDAIKKNNPKTLEELLCCMSVEPNKDPNLNPLRKKGSCKLFTTGQYILNPFTKSMYYYPVPGACKMEEKGAKVTADDIKNKHDKTSMYIIKTYDEISDVGNIQEKDLTFKNFFYND
jgi:hypothetical protein